MLLWIFLIRDGIQEIFINKWRFDILISGKFKNCEVFKLFSREFIKKAFFHETMTNFLYRALTKDNPFSLEMLYENAKKEHKDLWLNIRADNGSKCIQDLFICFRKRVPESN